MSAPLDLSLAAPFPPSLLPVRRIRHEIDVRDRRAWVVTTLVVAFGADHPHNVCIGRHPAALPCDAPRIEIDDQTTEGTPLGDDTWWICSLPLHCDDVVRVRITYELHLPADDLVRVEAIDLMRGGRLIRHRDTLGWDLRPWSPLSFAGHAPTEVTLRCDASWHAVGSSPFELHDGERMFAPLDCARFALVLWRAGAWAAHEVGTDGLSLTSLHPATDASFTPEQVRSVVGPILAAMPFKPSTRHAVIVHRRAPLGGGPMGTNVIGVDSQRVAEPAAARFIADLLGLDLQGSTEGFVRQLHADDADPMDAYLSDILLHELHHLTFGFGDAVEMHGLPHAFWFALGSGIVYDHVVAQALWGRPPRIIDAVEREYRQRFAPRRDLDQRLVDPDTTRDAQFGLDRTQIYAHGKASIVLRALRDEVGPRVFDEAMASFLGARSRGGYPAFRIHLATRTDRLPAHERAVGLR